MLLLLFNFQLFKRETEILTFMNSKAKVHGQKFLLCSTKIV